MAVTQTQPVTQPTQSKWQMDFNAFKSATEDYTNQMIQLAQGDYDFAAKYIEKEYKTALGNDDPARAQFLKSVANDLESKIGTIAYDYQTGKYRAERDITKQETKLKQSTQQALDRLNEDDRILREQKAREFGESRQSQAEELSARGILPTTREKAQGLAGSEVQKLETGIADQVGAMNRYLTRGTQDINTERTQGLEDLANLRTDTMENLTTTARRGALGAQTSYDYSIEAQKRMLEKQKQQLEAQKKRELASGANLFLGA